VSFPQFVWGVVIWRRLHSHGHEGYGGLGKFWGSKQGSVPCGTLHEILEKFMQTSGFGCVSLPRLSSFLIRKLDTFVKLSLDPTLRFVKVLLYIMCLIRDMSSYRLSFIRDIIISCCTIIIIPC
jgi:hypothetical protein